MYSRSILITFDCVRVRSLDLSFALRCAVVVVYCYVFLTVRAGWSFAFNCAHRALTRCCARCCRAAVHLLRLIVIDVVTGLLPFGAFDSSLLALVGTVGALPAVALLFMIRVAVAFVAAVLAV